MAINDKDFYASHGLDFDYKNMLDEYIKGVINQAKIEVLTELQSEIDELTSSYEVPNIYVEIGMKEIENEIQDLIQQKINKLRGEKNE